MPITHGSAAITMLQITDTACLKAITLDNLKRHTLLPLEGADDKTMGFVPIGDPFDTSWGSHPEVGEFLAFALRIDSKKVSAAVIKKHLQEAMEKEAKKNEAEGKKFISRARKKELKELIKMRLLSKAEAVPAVHELAIDKTTGVLFLGSSSNGVIKAVQELFFNAFKCELKEVQQEFSIDDQDKVSDFLTKIIRKGIRTDAATLAATGQMTVGDADKQISASSRTDDEIQEIHAAIQAGMKAVKTGLRIDTGDGEACTLSITPLLRISSMKLPTTQAKNDTEDPDALFLERMFLIGKYTSIVLNAFKAFAKGAAA